MTSKDLAVEVNIKEAGYKRGTPILKEISFSLMKGESLLVAGPTGSGKTTLIFALTGVLSNLLNGYVEGESRIAGLNPLDPNEFPLIASKVGVVLQDPDKQIAMSTPIDEVMFTLENLGWEENRALEKTEEALKWSGLEGKKLRSIEELSGGEKKRLCLAASIVHEPPLLIFDEPTANLDPWGVREVLNYIRETRRRGFTILVVEHKAGLILPLVDKLLIIHSGKQAEYIDLSKMEDIKEIRGRLVKYGVEESFEIPVKLEKPREGKPVAVVKNMWFKYKGQDEMLLRRIGFTVRSGEVVAIVGPNGSGKTTLGKLLAGILKPVEGSIIVQGVRPWTIKGVRRSEIAFYVPQEPDYMFVKPSIRGEIELISKSTGRSPEEFLGKMPGWVRDNLEVSPYRLSHGQRKWLSIQLAKTYSPKLLILDEPTAGLDLELFNKIVGDIEEYVGENNSVIVLTHDPRLVATVSSRCLILENHRLREVSVEEGLNYLLEAMGDADFEA